MKQGQKNRNISSSPKSKKKVYKKRPKSAKSRNKPRNKRLNQKKRLKKRRKKIKQMILEFLCSILIVSCCIWMASFFLFTVIKVEGYSMIPTLRSGELVYVNKLKKVENFSLVYMKNPLSGRKEIRRVIGLPGQNVNYKKDTLTIDQEEKQEKFIYDQILNTNKNGNLYTSDFSILSLIEKSNIPAEQYLVLGDNRLYATDSRTYGLVDKKNIIGVVTMRIFPFHMLKAF